MQQAQRLVEGGAHERKQLYRHRLGCICGEGRNPLPPAAGCGRSPECHSPVLEGHLLSMQSSGTICLQKARGQGTRHHQDSALAWTLSSTWFFRGPLASLSRHCSQVRVSTTPGATLSRAVMTAAEHSACKSAPAKPSVSAATFSTTAVSGLPCHLRCCQPLTHSGRPRIVAGLEGGSGWVTSPGSVHAQDGGPVRRRRQPEVDLPIKAAWPPEGRVDCLWSAAHMHSFQAGLTGRC